MALLQGGKGPDTNEWSAAGCFILTDDFHDMKLKLLRQHIQSGGERFLPITYQLQVLLGVVSEGQPHLPVLLRGHGERPEGNVQNHVKQLICSLTGNKRTKCLT